jgi:F-type H+-transporting ATPase subunit gamma
MPSLQNIRRKIASVKNTQKITKAMKMVAAAKFRRAQDRIQAARPYARRLGHVMSTLRTAVDLRDHSLLMKRAPKTVELLIITSDRGLCGAYNANLLRRAMQVIRGHVAQGIQVRLSLVGKKGREFLSRRGYPPQQVWTNLLDRLTYTQVIEISSEITIRFLDGTCDAVELIYTEFRSALQQRVTSSRLIPIELGLGASEDKGHEGEGDAPSAGEATVLRGDLLFEPSEAAVLTKLLPHYVEVQIFRALLESAASEMGARMTAMDSATRNAGELISRLTMTYNKTRQAAITKELMDIVGGAEALK